MKEGKDKMNKDKIMNTVDAMQKMFAEFAEQAKQNNQDVKRNVPDCFVSETQCEEFDW